MMHSEKRHTDRSYEVQLQDLRQGLLLMAGRVEEMIAQSVRALVDRDQELARRTIEQDHEVNRDEIDIDELCLLILAKRQPMASDLRFITLALKMVTDLERIGDLAVNISERALDLDDTVAGSPADATLRLAELSRSMVRDAIDAFLHRDAGKAQAAIDRDDEVDALYTEVFQEILALMGNDPSRLEWGIHMLSVVKWVERIADHGTNLAEQVIFMIRGKDIRHEGKLPA